MCGELGDGIRLVHIGGDEFDPHLLISSSDLRPTWVVMCALLWKYHQTLM